MFANGYTTYFGNHPPMRPCQRGFGLVLALALLAAREQLGRRVPPALLAADGQDGLGSAVVAAKQEILNIQALHKQRMAEARRRLALLTGEGEIG
jgi:hypothetical protein